MQRMTLTRTSKVKGSLINNYAGTTSIKWECPRVTQNMITLHIAEFSQFYDNILFHVNFIESTLIPCLGPIASVNCNFH